MVVAGVGCSRNSDNAVTGFIGGQQACLPGQILTADGRCLNQYACEPGNGFNGGGCEPGIPIPPADYYPGIIPSSFGATLQITNRHHFESFLERVGGVCNFSNFFYFSLFGPDPYDCDSYSNQGFIFIDIFSNTGPFSTSSPAYITIGAGANSPNDGYYGGMYGGLGYHTVPLNMVATPINDGEGFELKVSGGFFGGHYAGFHSSVTARVEDGNPVTDAGFQVVLYYNGSEFARTFVERQF